MTMQDPGMGASQAPQRRRSKKTGEVQILRNGSWETLISSTYARGMDSNMSKLDAETLTAARSQGSGAVSMAREGGRVQDLLAQGAPVGGGADLRISLGRALPDVVGRYVPGIPDKRETSMLEEIQRIGSVGALGDVGQLKGPLSEKELAFIRELQINPNATPETNNRVANAMRWVGARRAAYSRAAEVWQQTHGGLSVPAPNGMNFYTWWPSYAENNLPFPANEGPQETQETPQQLEAQGYRRDPQTGTYVRNRQVTPANEFVFNPATGQIEEAR
jgi:hypothetical protein